MAEITVEVSCGNSPKKELLKNYHIALANGDIDFIANNISDAINWEVVGHTTISNKDKFIGAIQEYKLWNVKQLIIDAIITHGIDASVNGRVVTESNLKFVFCDVYKFKGFKRSTIKSIKSFIIPEKV